MLRHSLLQLSQSKRLRRWFEQAPPSKRLTARFIAGRTLQDALAAARDLERKSATTALDYLGENVTTIEEAAASRDRYLAALDEIAAAKLSATVSLKLTQFGLDLSDEVCTRNVAAVVDRARSFGTRVEVDMEGSSYTERTLAIVKCINAEYPGSIRAVLQAYLYRTEADVRALSALHIPIRLCKGAYREPSSIAFPKKADVDANYVRLMRLLLEEGTDPAIASHDEQIVHDAVSYSRSHSILAHSFEFEMLYGIRRDLQRELAADGFRLRVYVPYGDAWYPYFVRRLAERPANVLFLLRNLFQH